MSSSKSKSKTAAAASTQRVTRSSTKAKVGRQRLQTESSASAASASASGSARVEIKAKNKNTMYRGGLGSDVEKLVLSFVSLSDLLRFHDASKDSSAVVVGFLQTLKRLWLLLDGDPLEDI